MFYKDAVLVVVNVEYMRFDVHTYISNLLQSRDSYLITFGQKKGILELVSDKISFESFSYSH